MNEQTLILYYYNDGLDAVQRNQVRNALASDPQLAQRYARLCSELDALSDFPQATAPAAAVDDWHKLITSAAQPRSETARHRPALWLLPAAAALVLGIGIGLRMAGSPVEQIADSTPLETADTRSDQTALTRGVAAYMQQSRTELASLDDASDVQRRALVGELVEQNRLFERRAAASGAPDLARVLRGFEQLLLAMAQDEGDAGQLTSQREQLSFEYAVMLTKLAREPSNETHSL